MFLSLWTMVWVRALGKVHLEFQWHVKRARPFETNVKHSDRQLFYLTFGTIWFSSVNSSLLCRPATSCSTSSKLLQHSPTLSLFRFFLLLNQSSSLSENSMSSKATHTVYNIRRLCISFIQIFVFNEFKLTFHLPMLDSADYLLWLVTSPKGTAIKIRSTTEQNFRLMPERAVFVSPFRAFENSVIPELGTQQVCQVI